MLTFHTHSNINSLLTTPPTQLKCWCYVYLDDSQWDLAIRRDTRAVLKPSLYSSEALEADHMSYRLAREVPGVRYNTEPWSCILRKISPHGIYGQTKGYLTLDSFKSQKHAPPESFPMSKNWLVLRDVASSQPTIFN